MIPSGRMTIRFWSAFMPKKWFQMEEQGAGTGRLIASYYLYKIFGAGALRVIAFFVVLGVFITAKERRDASFKFYKILNKPPLISSFKQFLNYGNALVDKFISFCGDLNTDKFEIKNSKVFNGAFFINTHIGNIEILRSLLSLPQAKRANVFLQADACKVFNNFLKTLETKVNMDVFPVEEISAETSITISDRLKDGEIVFMAGDRVSAQNTNMVYEGEFLGQKIRLPLGTLKFALMMNCPIYFIICAKEGKSYIIHTEEFVFFEGEKRSERLNRLKSEYVKFLEKYTLKYPYQFYHFFDIFS